jgi:hypothetical protein
MLQSHANDLSSDSISSGHIETEMQVSYIATKNAKGVDIAEKCIVFDSKPKSTGAAAANLSSGGKQTFLADKG